MMTDRTRNNPIEPDTKKKKRADDQSRLPQARRDLCSQIVE
jgi:hypothetical protein